MKTGLKVWLWIVFVWNIILTVLILPALMVAPFESLLRIAMSVVFIVGVAMILFRQQKMGFYLMCGASVVAFVVNLIGGSSLWAALIGMVLCPGITFLIMRSDWDSFE